MHPVAYLEGILKEIKPCTNPDYFMAIFNFPQEVFGKVFKVEEMPQPKSTSILCDSKNHQSVLNLKPGQKYKLQVSLRVSPANEYNGKRYPASVSYNIIAAQSC